MIEAKRKSSDKVAPQSDDSPDDTPGTRAGGDVGSKERPVPDDPPFYDDESMAIDPPDNTGGGWG